MSGDLQEIKGILDKINPALVGLRTDIDGLKERDPLDDERFKKQADFVTKGMEQLQALEEKAKALEAAINREDRGGSDEEKAAAEHEKKADDFLRRGIDLKGNEPGAKFGLEIRAMSTDVNPDGGYLLRPQFINKIVGREFETSPMRGMADVISASAKSIELMIDDDEADVNRVGEGSASSDTDTPEIGMKTIAAHKYDATPKVTTEMLQDAAFDVERWLADKVANRIARKENYDFVLGSGVNSARGFLSYPAWATAGTYERGKIEQRNLGAAAALTANGLIELQGDLLEVYQGNANWLMHRTTYAKALTLSGADQYHFGPVLLKDGVTQSTLLGKPVRFMGDMPSVAANALAVAYGDFRTGYTIYDRVGVIVLRDPFSAHGFVSFYTTKRTGGDVTSYDSIKVGKIAA